MENFEKKIWLRMMSFLKVVVVRDVGEDKPVEQMQDDTLHGKVIHQTDRRQVWTEDENSWKRRLALVALAWYDKG